MDVDELRQREVHGASFDLLFFWGHRPLPNAEIGTNCLSQWWAAPFEADGDLYATAEHYVMVSKARLFGDEAMAAHILKSRAPEEAIDLGREVRGFEQSVWIAARYDIVVAANRAKFTAHPELGRYLTQHTGDKILVHANPGDPLWGIGLAANDIRARKPTQWRGKNQLGFALMEVREELRCS
ncbi:MAG TPA: NADAR family protein [Acidimicrobiales bacterium]|nr:NADAR family protein [Acidimicrobiales bacterium]